MRRKPSGWSSHAALLGVLPFLVMALLAVADVLTGAEVELLPLMSLGPAFAALSGGIWHTLSAGTVALALTAADAAYEDMPARRITIILLTVAGVTSASLIASASRQRRERELAHVRSVAKVAQEVLLRPAPREVAQMRLAVRYISASAHAEIGGDVYEVVPAPDGVRLLIGDVQGKGLPAVKTASVVLGAFREAAYHVADLTLIAARLEESLRRQLAEEEFVSAILADISLDGARLRLLSCGHPPPLLLPGRGAPRFLESEPSLPLGLGALAKPEHTITVVDVAPGDQVLFYTDGVSEARSAAGEYYPLARRVAALVGEDPDDRLRSLHDDLIRHVGHRLDDDAALLLAGRLAAGADLTPLCSVVTPAEAPRGRTMREACHDEPAHPAGVGDRRPQEARP